MKTCVRCKTETAYLCVSWFNRDEICGPCSDDEAFCPSYFRAVQAESDALRNGDWDFDGIGLSPIDQDVLYHRRTNRGKAEPRTPT